MYPPSNRQGMYSLSNSSCCSSSVATTSTGTGSDSLTWSGVAPSTTRTLTSFTDSDGTYNVTNVSLASGILSLTLASFIPTFTMQSSSSLNWDQLASGQIFAVTITNPVSFTTTWITSVNSIVCTYGNIPQSITAFSTSDTITYNHGGGTGTQNFRLGTGSHIYSDQSTGSLTGGSAVGYLTFNTNTGAYTPSPMYLSGFRVSWLDINQSITLSLRNSTSNSATATFLNRYESAGWDAYISNIANFSCVSNTSVALTNGNTTDVPTAQNHSTGTMIFTTPLNILTAVTTSIAFKAYYTRPAGILGLSSGSIFSNTATGILPVPTFTYPSFWFITADLGATTLTSSDVISGSYPTAVFNGTRNVNPLGQTSQITTITNVGSTSLFWFGCWSALSKPSSFKLATYNADNSLNADGDIRKTQADFTISSGPVTVTYSAYYIVLNHTQNGFRLTIA